MNATTALLRSLLDRGDYLEGLTRDELAAMLPILERAHEEVLGKIAKARGKWSEAWLVEVAADIDDIYQAAARECGKLPGLEKIASDEAEYLAGILGDLVVGVSVFTPSVTLLRNLPIVQGSTLDQLFEALGVNSREAVVEAIQMGMAEGETVEELTRRIRGNVVKRASWRRVSGKRRYIPGVYEGGVLEDVSTRQAEVLARTAVMTAANQGREQFYDANRDLIKGYQRVETLDALTCIVCGVEDGRFYKLDEPRPVVPVHPDCRGTYVPVLKSFRELGMDVDLPPSTRASMNGQVPETTTWQDRVRDLSPEKRKAILGPGRAAMYDGGMKLEDLVRDGKLVPLKELRK